MRSSKSRSRNKSNRQRSIGNVVNRVFDSSGPEGKVRGTPQQIIDKYLMLARDAQLGNDRVAEQNFLQHAEHYTRMLGEAQRELAREQEERQRQHQQNNGNNGNNGNREQREPRDEAEQPRVVEENAIPEPMATEDEGPGLVETPEMRAEESAPEESAPTEAEEAPRRPRARRPRKPKAAQSEGAEPAEVSGADGSVAD